MEAGTPPHALTATFVTHVHSDHVVGLPDLAMTRWVQQQLVRTGALVVVAPEGGACRFVGRMLDAFDEDIALRRDHVGAGPVEIDLRPFPVTPEPSTVWTSDDGTVHVDAVAVHHEPVPDAVAYRVTTPDGVVVISGDTRVCDEVGALAEGADVLVHEACRTAAMTPLIAGTTFETIFDYHADTVALGGLAARAEVSHLVLTHLIPPLEAPGDEEAFVDDVRSGGYAGPITVGRDLATITIG
jgi:ribonuclease Z